MAKHRIHQDGQRTKFFWSDRDGNDRKQRTVYKETEGKITKMLGVRFDVDANRFNKD